MQSIKYIVLTFLYLFLVQEIFSQNTDNIRLNQTGYYTKGPKVAILVNASSPKFSIVRADTKKVVFSGTLGPAVAWKFSNEKASKADFSSFHLPGAYLLSADGSGISHPFVIGTQVHLPVGKAALKMYYYQRASMELTAPYAGKWARKAGHPDNEVLVHPSAATAERPANTKLNCPRGWYDAGDYNKYIVNSGISMYTLLALYEHYPSFMDTLQTHIPESGNNIPDLLDEVLWNLRWMLTMQDLDGGVYHKLTNPTFDGSIAPEAATGPRYVVQKTTAATMDFAAVTAQAFRVFKKLSKQLPGLADSCLAASELAYTWGKKNPFISYRQEELNASFDPDILTGAYQDNELHDELQWAAIELFISTGKINYYQDADLKASLQHFKLPNWASVNTLGLYSLIHHRKQLPQVKEMESLKVALLQLADQYKKNALTSAFGVPMGLSEGDFNWGSNSNAANQGMLLVQAYNLTGDQSYLVPAIASLDYLLGRNGTGYSFLTGYGEKSTRNPHSRPSESDGVDEPVPGLLAGGPNPGMQDAAECAGKYTNSFPAKAYLDDRCSYASNEIAINWNAPFSYLALAMEVLMDNKRNNK